MSRFIKIGSTGKKLKEDAAKWDGVLDTTTGLIWSVNEFKEMPWKKAIEWVKKLKACGSTDWRLPTVEELFLLADRSKHNSAIDKAFFPNCKSNWCWTSTPYAASPGGCAWLVSFGSGPPKTVKRSKPPGVIWLPAETQLISVTAVLNVPSAVWSGGVRFRVGVV